jgi:4-carboxymuconolactone decarboxylase|tara:strand:- start:197 stop:688 length:492 start_codon:yes stop_codon:yes gene_type:complete
MPPRKNVKIPPRALKRGTMLWNKEFTEGIAADMADWADPAFMKMFMEFCYGGLYDRNVLPQKTRELCAVAACVMANANPQLRTHIQAAWNCGSTKREIMEVILQMATYCGMPYMLQAARTANDIFPSLKRGKKAGELPPAIKAKLSKAKKTAGAKGKSGARRK